VGNLARTSMNAPRVKTIVTSMQLALTLRDHSNVTVIEVTLVMEHIVKTSMNATTTTTTHVT
jgi:hypothetical protein